MARDFAGTEVEHGQVEETECGRWPARVVLVEELPIVLPCCSVPQEHLGQELSSMMAAGQEAEQLLRVQE